MNKIIQLNIGKEKDLGEYNKKLLMETQKEIGDK
jgi:hypothetical protein